MGDGVAILEIPLVVKLECHKATFNLNTLEALHTLADSGVIVVVCGLLLLAVALVAHLQDDVGLLLLLLFKFVCSMQYC